MRILSIILLTLWTLFSWYYYVCKIKQACWGGNHTTATTIPNSQKAKPLNFRWSSYQIPLDSGFPDLRKAILQHKEDAQILKITGYYYLSESLDNPSIDLGLARASEVKKKLLKELPENQIQIFSTLLPADEVPSDSLVEAIQFEWEAATVTADLVEEDTPLTNIAPSNNESDSAEDVEEESEESELEEETAPITRETLNGEDYYVKQFAPNTNRLPAAFMDVLAERVLAENKKVVIRGHTDSVGDKETNFQVGLRRAKRIRDQLIKRGVAKKNIETTSDGEDSPIASNKTSEGRHLNRRIEIILK